MSAPGSARADAWLWLAQRLSAAVLALAVVVHLGTIIGAVQGGLSAAEIVSRLRGHHGWLAFYSLFVIAASIHAPLGVRTMLREWTRLGAAGSTAICATLAAAMLVLGLRAALAMYVGPA